ncbi:MAG: anti-sigma factor antagonist [Eubacteriales bacterium]|nr:anti-sigma factor antagonist [Eubacteriales bacterium]
MKFESANGTLTIYLTGRVDSSNAETVEKEMQSILAANSAEKLVLDAEDLAYISSAGLRVVLRLRKANATLKIVNASSEVYDIFEMTGFTEMIPIEKAYRRLSVEGCEVIGQGANGKVYRLDPDTIIKVYLNPDSLPDIHRERELARKAFVMGIPTAIPYDVVKVGDGYGSVFELLSAKSFAKLLIADPANLDMCVKLSVDLLKKIHATELKKGDMPDMKTVALGWADFLADYLPADQYEKLRSLIAAVPDDNHMLHGDYHIKNVMLQNGETLLIDMDTLCLGHPVFEFASIFLAYVGFGEVDHESTRQFLGIPYEMGEEFWHKTLHLYFNTDDEAKCEAIANKARVIGYARMMRRTIRRNGLNTPEGQAMIANCRSQLAKLLPVVDTLCFD